MTIEFVCATNNEEVLENNLLRSPIYMRYPFIFMQDYENISKAYNEAHVSAEIIVYVHQDVYLPESFEDDLLIAQSMLYDWSIIGVAGVNLVNGKKENYGNILDRGKEWKYNVDELPCEVQTLDELLIITHGDFKFDENLDLDFYASDICLQARQQGRKCYAINAYCEHNSTRKIGERTESFYRCEKYFREKWQNYLPICTTCAILQP